MSELREIAEAIHLNGGAPDYIDADVYDAAKWLRDEIEKSIAQMMASPLQNIAAHREMMTGWMVDLLRPMSPKWQDHVGFRFVQDGMDLNVELIAKTSYGSDMIRGIWNPNTISEMTIDLREGEDGMSGLSR